MITKIPIVTLAGFVVGALLMVLSNQTISAQVARERWKKLAVYFLIVHLAVACAAAGTATIFLFVVLIVVTGAFELGRASAYPGFGSHRNIMFTWFIYAMVAAATVATTLMLSPTEWLLVYLLVATFDGMSQVVGQLLGRHLLAPRISPGKTVEGAIGGLAATLVVGIIFRELVWPHAGAALLLAASISLAGLTGDLAASWVKRKAGIKDYGTKLPGQGGVLDRFDSFLAASTVVGPVIYFVGLT
jgi:phosphatidate cytidylyltransferase